VTEVQTRDGGSHVFLRVTTNPNPRTVAARADDLVTMERSVKDALQRIAR
jgi:hypothetical protein